VWLFWSAAGWAVSAGLTAPVGSGKITDSGGSAALSAVKPPETAIMNSAHDDKITIVEH
jgi:hypothetical protein